MTTYQTIKGRVTAKMILNTLNERGLKANRGANYSIHIVRNVLSGRTDDKNILSIVSEFAAKVKELKAV
jgi:hypothetical protein